MEMQPVIALLLAACCITGVATTIGSPFLNKVWVLEVDAGILSPQKKNNDHDSFKQDPQKR